MFPILGLIGTVLVAIAYIPQIHHLWAKKCAAAISLYTWGIWAVATVLILIHAFSGSDLVFKIFTSVNMIAIVITLVLVSKYHTQTCKLHQ